MEATKNFLTFIVYLCNEKKEMMNKNCESPENHFTDDYEPFPLDFSEWTLLDDTSGDDDNLEEGDTGANQLDYFHKSSHVVSTASVNSTFVNQKDSCDENRKNKSPNSKQEANSGTATQKSKTSRLPSQSKSKDDISNKHPCFSQTSQTNMMIIPSEDSVVHAVSNSVANEMKENLSNNAEVKNISKLHSKSVGNEESTQKPNALRWNKQSALQRQNQCENFGNNFKNIRSGGVIHKDKDFISGYGAKANFEKITEVGTGLDHCDSTSICKLIKGQKSETGKLKGNKRTRKNKNSQLLKSKNLDSSQIQPPPRNTGTGHFIQVCQEAHLEEDPTQDNDIYQQLSLKKTENVKAFECSIGMQQTSCPVQNCSVKCFHLACETDSKTFVNKQFAQCRTKQSFEPENSPLEQCAPVGIHCENDKKLSNHSSESADSNFPYPKSVSKEIFSMAMNFEVSNSFSSLSPLVNFEYGVRVGYLLPSDVDKASFRDTFINKADSYNLFFASRGSGVLDLFFYEEESLTNTINHIRKARLGLRHLCLSIYKVSKEKDNNGEVPVKCLKATIIFDQNFVSSAYLSYCKKSMENRPRVDKYITINNVPEGIPLSFLSFIFPDAITIELGDADRKFTKKSCNVRLGMNSKNYPEHFKDLFCQVFINNVPVLMTGGLNEENDIPEIKDKTVVQKKPDDLKERIQNQKEKESNKIQSTVAVVDDVDTDKKKNSGNESREEKIATTTETPKSPVFSADLPPPEDIIDLTGEASSPFVNLNDDLSEISDSSFNSDDLEGPLFSSSEDERSSQPNGREKSKTFDRLYDKYVFKKRRKERHEKIHEMASSDQDFAKIKGSKLSHVTRDVLSSIRKNRKAEKGSSKKETSNYSSESHHRRKSKKHARRSRESNCFLNLLKKDKTDHGNILKHRGSNSPPRSKIKSAILECRDSQKMSKSQERRIAERSRSPPRHCDPSSCSYSRQIVQQRSDRRGQSEERDLRLTTDNMRMLHPRKKTKAGGGATEDSAPAFRSLLGECLSQVNKKRPPSRSPSPTQRKVLLVKRSFSPTLQLEMEECFDSSHSSISERNWKMDLEMDESFQTSSFLSSNKMKDLHMSVQASDKVLNERCQPETEQNASQEQFTISKSLMVKLMRQIIKKNAQPDVDDHTLTSENWRKEAKTLDIDQDTDLSISSHSKDNETGRYDEGKLQLVLQQSSEGLTNSTTTGKISETKDIPVAAQKQESKRENKLVIKAEDNIPEGTGEMFSKSDPKKKERNSPSVKSSSELPILPPPIPPPVLPTILAMSSETPCSQSHTTLPLDPLNAAFSEGGIWMAPPPMTLTTTSHHKPFPTTSVSSVSTPLPALSQISPTVLKPPIIPPVAFIVPPPIHPQVLFPPHQLQAPRVQASIHDDLIPLSGVWQAPPQGPF